MELVFFSKILVSFQATLSLATVNLQKISFAIVSGLLLLEFITVVFNTGIKRASQTLFISLLIRLMLVIGILTTFPITVTGLAKTVTKWGLMSENSTMTVNDFLNPDKILTQGIKQSQAMTVAWQESLTFLGKATSWLTVAQPWLYGVAAIIIICSFLLQAGAVFLLQVELALAMPLMVILVPFGMFTHTRFLAQGVINYVPKVLCKFFIMAIIVAAVGPMLENNVLMFQAPAGANAFDKFGVDTVKAIAQLTSAIILGWLFIWGPRIATHILSGHSTVDAGHAARGGAMLLQSTRMLTTNIQPLIGSRALAAYGDADGPSAANNPLWSRKYTARLLRRSDASASVHGCAGTRNVRLGDEGSVG